MTHPLPARLRRDGTTQRPRPPAEAPVPAPLIVYLAVPDERLLKAIRKSRVFVSEKADRPIELRAFHPPGFPNLPDEAIRLLGNLTEIGEVVDQPLVTVSPEPLRR